MHLPHAVILPSRSHSVKLAIFAKRQSFKTNPPSTRRENRMLDLFGANQLCGNAFNSHLRLAVEPEPAYSLLAYADVYLYCRPILRQTQS